MGTVYRTGQRACAPAGGLMFRVFRPIVRGSHILSHALRSASTAYSSGVVPGAVAITAVGLVIAQVSVLHAASLPGPPSSAHSAVKMFRDLNYGWKREVLIACAFYPRTYQSLKEDADCEVTYSGDVQSFKVQCEVVSKNIHLRALGSVSAVKDVLDAITAPGSTLFDDLCLDVVDSFVVQRVGRPIVRFTREKSEKEKEAVKNKKSKEDLGVSLFLEINEVRQRASTVAQYAERVGVNVSQYLPYLGWGFATFTLGLLSRGKRD